MGFFSKKTDKTSDTSSSNVEVLPYFDLFSGDDLIAFSHQPTIAEVKNYVPSSRDEVQRPSSPSVLPTERPIREKVPELSTTASRLVNTESFEDAYAHYDDTDITEWTPMTERTLEESASRADRTEELMVNAKEFLESKAEETGQKAENLWEKSKEKAGETVEWVRDVFSEDKEAEVGRRDAPTNVRDYGEARKGAKRTLDQSRRDAEWLREKGDNAYVRTKETQPITGKEPVYRFSKEHLHTETPWEGVKRKGHEMVEGMAKSKDQVLHKGEKAAERTEDYVSDKARDVQKGAKVARDMTYDTARGVKEGAKEMGERTKEGMREARDYTYDKAKDVKEGAKEMGERTMEGAKETGEYAYGKAEDMGQWVKEEAKEVRDYVYEKAEDVKEGLVKAKDYVYDKTEDVGQWVKGGAKEARDVTYEKAKGAKEGLVKARDTVYDKAQDVKEGTKEGLKETRDYTYDKAEGAKEGLVKARDAVYDKTQDVKESAKGMGEWIKESAEETKDYVYEKAADVKRPVGYVGEKVREGAIKATDTTEYVVTEGLEATKKGVEYVADKTRSVLGEEEPSSEKLRELRREQAQPKSSRSRAA